MTNRFGPILDAADVEAALLAHLELWLPTYIAEVVRQKDPDGELWPDGVEPVRSFTVVHAAEEKWPEDQIPMILAYSPGLTEPPEYHGDGEVSAKYAVGLAAIAGADTMANTKALTRVYASAAKAAIVQHEDLGGFALGTRWVDERNYPVVQGVDVERNLMAVSATYEIEAAAVLDRDEGPQAPSTEEQPPWGTVKSSEVTVEIVEDLPG